MEKVPIYRLIIEDDEGKTTAVPFLRDEITIGRREGNTIRLTERNVSRRHAKLIRANGDISIEDLDSYNGIKINGDRIVGRTRIKEGDLIQIGDYFLAIQRDESADEISLGEEEESGPPSPHELAAQAAADPEVAMRVTGEHNAAFVNDESTGRVPMPGRQPGASDIDADATAVVRIDQQDISQPTEMGYIPPPHGKLVALTSDLAGQEFVLDHTPMTVGRSSDTDISIDHRSISRHHITLEFSDGVYTVLDKGSANGILINGETYRRATLRPGDVLELGHVKLRYVGPGEDFVFGQESQQRPRSSGALDKDADLDSASFKPSIPMPLKIGLGAGAVLCVVGLAIFLTGDKEEPADANGAEKASIAGNENIPPPPPLSNKTDVDLLARARANKAAGRYTDAKQDVEEYLGGKPGDETAKHLLALIDDEMTNARFISDARDRFGREQFEDALAALDKVPADSELKREAEELRNTIRDRWIEDLLDEGYKLRQHGSHDEALEVYRKALKIDPANEEAAEAVKSIKENRDKAVAASRKRSSGRKSGRSSHRSSSRKSSQRSAPPEKEPEAAAVPQPAPSKQNKVEVFKEGEKLFYQGQMQAALKKFKQVLKLDPNYAIAWRNIGAVYAKLGNNEKAIRAYKTYLRLRPSSPEAPQLKRIIESYEKSTQR